MLMTSAPNTAAARAGTAPGRWIGAGWNIVAGDLGNFVLMTLIALVLTLAAGVTVVGILVVAGPFTAGLFVAVRRRMQEGRSDLMDVFQGFNRFVDTLLLGLLVSVFSLIGLAFCVIPFFVVGAFYLFAFPFQIDRNLSFWEAMRASRRVTAEELAGYVAFFLILCMLNLVGLMLAGVGLLITIPVSIAAIAAAYQDVVGFQPQPQQTAGPIIIP